MKRSILAAALFFAGSALAQDYKLGANVGDFAVQDLKGAPVAFNQVKGDLTVVVFIATQCPVSNAYNERIKSLYTDYTPKGVHFLFVNANSTESAADVALHAQSHAFPFPVYKDAGNVVADRFGAQATPEVYVMDKAGTMRYHGSIDDSQEEARLQNQWLRKALDAQLAGQPVEKSQTKAFGCSIKRVRKSL